MVKEDQDYMLTTYDNPYNPFTEWDMWWKTDLLLGHDCCGLLGRTANYASISSDEIKEKEISDAVDEIIKKNPTIYKKVFRSDYNNKDLDIGEGS